MTFEFLLTSLVVVLLPGTGVIYTLAIGLGQGFKPSIAAAFGCTLGIVPAAIAGIVGLAAVFHTSALAFQVLKYLGVAYLFYMAWNILRDGGALDVTKEKANHSTSQIILNGILLNIFNPKLSLFFLAFLPQFVSIEGAEATKQLVLLASVFMAITFVVFVLYGAFAAWTRDYIIAKPMVMKWMRRSFAGVFGLLGLKLALSDR